MKFMSPVLVVQDMEKSLEFYKSVFDLEVIEDFGANKTLTGGISLQTAETYEEFIESSKISYGGCDSELYFEEEDFDSFWERVKQSNVSLVHSVREHSWGQRVIRLFDPDGHILEVGEKMETVVQRFLHSGLSPEEIAKRMDVPPDYILSMLRDESV